MPTEEDTHQCKYRTAIEKLDAMKPADWRGGQDHLSPVFREVNFKAAFGHVINIVNSVTNPAMVREDGLTEYELQRGIRRD